MISHHQSIDNSLLSYPKKFSPIGQKMAELWSKMYGQICKYGIIDILRAILANNFAKYQYFSTKPSLFHMGGVTVRFIRNSIKSKNGRGQSEQNGQK